MSERRTVLMAAATLPIAGQAAARAPNQVTGTWRIVTATVEANGKTSRPYGPRPQGKLVFTPDLHFVEFIRDATIPRFVSNERGGGTDAENRAVMAGTRPLWPIYRRRRGQVQRQHGRRLVLPQLDRGRSHDK